MFDKQYDIDETTAKLMQLNIPQLAGMTIEEIRKFVTIMNIREHIELEKEWEKAQADKRSKDEEYMASEEFKKDIIPTAPVVMEPVMAIISPPPVIDGVIYISEKDLKIGISKLKIRIDTENDKRVLYIPANFKEWVRTIDKCFSR